MFILKKLFELRDKTHQSDEKPFLEHLEDLRIVITRIVVTLVIAMGICFAFRNDLMSIIRAPVEKVWLESQENKMPGEDEGSIEVDLKTWELAKKADRDIVNFTPEQKESYFKYLDEDGSKHLKFHTQIVPYYRAALEMEKADQDGEKFIKNLPGITDDQRKQILTLLDKEKRPDASVDSRGKLVLMQALNPTEGFMLSIKLALYAGIILSFPLLGFFLLQFILPGLKDNEKKALWPSLIIGFGLFLTGVLFSYFFVLPKVLDFFYTYSQDMGVENEWRIGYYISFSTQFTLIFGLCFELPVIVMAMVKLGILNYDIMKNTRSYAILAIVIIAALITPTPDAFTLLLLSGPMIVLYEICIWLAFFHNKKQRAAELAEKEELDRKLESPAPHATSRDDDEDDSNGEDDDPDDDGPSPSDEGASPKEKKSDLVDSPKNNSSRRPYSRDIEEDEEFDFHNDRETDHYNYREPYPLGDESDVHAEDEGDEEDNGTYDFSEEELEKEFSYDDPSLSSSDPHEDHFYDDLDEDFEVVDSSVKSPIETKEVSDVSSEKLSEKTQKPADQSSLQKKGKSPHKDSSSDEEEALHKKNDGKPSSQS